MKNAYFSTAVVDFKKGHDIGQECRRVATGGTNFGEPHLVDAVGGGRVNDVRNVLLKITRR